MGTLDLRLHNINNAGFDCTIMYDRNEETPAFVLVRHKKKHNTTKALAGPEVEPLVEELERYCTNYSAFIETAPSCHH